MTSHYLTLAYLALATIAAALASCYVLATIDQLGRETVFRLIPPLTITLVAALFTIQKTREIITLHTKQDEPQDSHGNAAPD